MQWKRHRLLWFAGTAVVLGAGAMVLLPPSPRPSGAPISETNGSSAEISDSASEAARRPPPSPVSQELPALPPLTIQDLRPAAPPAEPVPETVAAVYAEAHQRVQGLLDKNTNSPDCLELMARLLMSMGRSEEAEQHWKRAIELNPKYAYAYDGLAEVAAKRGDLEEARGFFEKSLQISPGAARTLLEFSRVLVKLGDSDKAVETLRKHILLDPRSQDGHLLLGEVLLRKGDYQGAKEAYLAATALDPVRPHGWYGLGTACRRLNQTEEARRHLEKNAQLWARAKETTDMAAILSDVDGARRDVARVYTTLARLLAARGEHDEAEWLWRRATRFDPRAPEPLFLLAAFYRQTHREPEAFETAEELAKMRRDDPLHGLDVAVLYAQLGRFAAAEAMLARCRETAPHATWPLRESARFYLRVLRKPSEALRFASRAAEQEPVAVNFVLLGEACRQTGDREGARAALRKAQELEPANPNHAQALKLLESSP